MTDVTSAGSGFWGWRWVRVRFVADPSRGGRLSWLLSECVGCLCRFPPVSRRKGSMTSQSDTQWVTACLSVSNAPRPRQPASPSQTNLSAAFSHRKIRPGIFPSCEALNSPPPTPTPYDRVTTTPTHPRGLLGLSALCGVLCCWWLVSLCLAVPTPTWDSARLDVCGTLAVSVCMPDCDGSSKNLHDRILTCIQVLCYHSFPVIQLTTPEHGIISEVSTWHWRAAFHLFMHRSLSRKSLPSISIFLCACNKSWPLSESGCAVTHRVLVWP